MVRVIVRCQYTCNCHTVLLGDAYKIVNGIRRVNQNALTGNAVTDEVCVVHHLARQRIADRKISAAQKLTEVKRVDVGLIGHTEQNRSMPGQHVLRTGDRVLVGGVLITVDQDFAESLEAGDTVIGLARNSLCCVFRRRLKNLPLMQ